MVRLRAGFAYPNEPVGASGGRRKNSERTSQIFCLKLADAFEDFGDALAFDVKQAAAELRHGKLRFQVFFLSA